MPDDKPVREKASWFFGSSKIRFRKGKGNLFLGRRSLGTLPGRAKRLPPDEFQKA